MFKSCKLIPGLALSLFIITLVLPQFSFCQDLEFSEEIQITSTHGRVSAIAYGDINGDGNMDIVIASDDADLISWYKSADGLGTFYGHQVISDEADAVRDVCLADLDDDGDIDVIAANSMQDEILWYENLDGLGDFGEGILIAENVDRPVSVVAADIDDDDDLDLVAAMEDGDTVIWYENTDGAGSFDGGTTISSSANGANSVFIIDIDGDSDLDVFVSSRNDNTISWFENSNGQGSFGDEQIIDNTAGWARDVYGADIDGDGDIDAVAAHEQNDYICWYENLDGAGSFGAMQEIDASALAPWSVCCADLDGDEDIDVAWVGNDNSRVGWSENLDGSGNSWDSHPVQSDLDETRCVVIVDLDGDGDNDMISGSTGESWLLDKVVWYENEDGEGDFSGAIQINSQISEPTLVELADLDGDGDNDILGLSYVWDDVFYLENLGGNGLFSHEIIIDPYLDNPTCLKSVDLDDDGDIDIVATSGANDQLVWYENQDGLANFSQAIIISDEVDYAKWIDCCDIDNDGDIDIVVSASAADAVMWFENIDGQATFGEAHLINDNLDVIRCISCADFDGDGDLDVVATAYMDNKISWFANIDGQGTFGDEIIIASNVGHPYAVHTSDLDGDGDIDILMGSESNAHLRWYENTDGAGTFGTATGLDYFALDVRSIQTFDFDYDGDNDIVYATYGSDDIKMFENYGNGTFSDDIRLSTTADGAHSVFCGDVDGDGDTDIISASQENDKIAWFANLASGVPPFPFNLTEPDSGSVWPDTTVTFRWNEAEDPDNNIAYYEVYISEILSQLQYAFYDYAEADSFVYHGENGSTFYWTVAAVDGHLNRTFSSNQYRLTLEFNGINWNLSNDLPEEYELTSIYPNPFNPVTNINIALPQSSDLSLTVYNLLGQKVAVLSNGMLNAGYHNFTFNGENLPSGVYFVHAFVADRLDIRRKIVLTK